LLGRDLVQQETDETLARRGDAPSFTQLYERYVTVLRAYLYAQVSNLEDTDDLTSVVFTRAWSKRSTYRGNGSFRSWLFAIARRAVADYYRGRRAWLLVFGFPEALPATTGDPQVAVEAGEQWQRLGRLLRDLTPEQREVLQLHFRGELSYGEIARILGKREEAVKMQAYRALAELRRRYPDGG
jgi:RNA polymerase sigma factor (sigma-70 family)